MRTRRQRWRRLAVAALAAAAAAYVVAYLGASRSGTMLSETRHRPPGEFLFGSMTGRPDPDPVGHEVAAVLFWPPWRLEHACGGPRPCGYADAAPPCGYADFPRRARRALPFSVTYSYHGPSGRWYRVDGRKVMIGARAAWLTGRQAALLRAWWREHDPLSFVPPDCEQEFRRKYGATYLELVVDAPGGRVRVVWWRYQHWCDPAVQARMTAAFVALRAALEESESGA